MRTAFVAMAISDATDQRWQAIREGIRQNPGSLVATRADLDSHAFIIEGILRSIDDAGLVVADLTPTITAARDWSWNPNVLFELGYAVSRRSPICLVCSKNEAPSRFPFDIAHQRVFLFESDAELVGHLARFDASDSDATSFAGSPSETIDQGISEAGKLMIGVASDAAKEAQDYFVHLQAEPEAGVRFARWLHVRRDHEREALRQMEADSEKVPDGLARTMIAFAIGTQKVKLQCYERLAANIHEGQDPNDVAWWLARIWTDRKSDCGDTG